MVETFHEASIANMLSKQRITKVMTRLRGCTGWPATVLSARNKVWFSRVDAQPQ